MQATKPSFAFYVRSGGRQHEGKLSSHYTIEHIIYKKGKGRKFGRKFIGKEHDLVTQRK